MNKVEIFLSEQNIVKIAAQKGFTFGKMKSLMQEWQSTKNLNSYESLIYDPLAEMEIINQEFLKTINAPQALPKLLMPSDYHNMDTTTVPDTYVSAETYRFNNTIPLYQRIPDRHYDHEGSGLHGRSLDSRTVSVGKMDELFNHCDKPYRQYYPQQIDDSSTILVYTK